MRFPTIALLLAFIFVAANAHVPTAAAQTPPEIVASSSGQNGFKPTFDAIPIPPDIESKMRRYSWRAGCPVPISALTLLTVSYRDFHARPQQGALIVNREVAADASEIFRHLFEHGFLIERMEPVENFAGDDEQSMAANNTSAFNCRDITGRPGKFSNHSWGRAIDINPLTNPFLLHGKALPPQGTAYADRTLAWPGSILANSFIVSEFTSRGWTWGGIWPNPDFQHFEKTGTF